MLVVMRRSGQDVVITLPDGQRIVVTVVRVNGTTARIAINAPATVGILRGEVQRKIDEGYSHAVSGHDGPEHMDGTQEAAATDGP